MLQNNKVLVYTKEGCPYCFKAKTFLEKLRIPYSEVSLSPYNPDYNKQKEKVFNHFQKNTFPIILVGSMLIGGSSDLEASY